MNNDSEDLKINPNDIERHRPLKVSVAEDEVDRIADLLVDMLGSDESRPYFCKVARLIPVETLERFANDELEVGRNHGKLFTYLTKREIARRYPQKVGDTQ